MEAIEIILLIIGVLVFVLSFIIPAKKEGLSAETKEETRKEIETMISADVENAKIRIGDIVDETVTYSIEKTERSLERLSNEKIMAVSEYADTVLEEINKSHKEIMFLYDMLNDKQESIKETVAEVNKSVKQAENAAGVQSTPETAVSEKELNTGVKNKGGRSTAGKTKSTSKTEKKVSAGSPDISFISEEDSDGKNNNDMILMLHKQGKSNVAIAKELGLGVGEVKLVIGLFEGI